ncbi:calcium-binding tyrosine phosphorylation-regulated protein isoform X1 [Sapajus apella]|uniref:Calcium-binding tyrosine phosphorylation-regulated protein isoform X1 n=2 Tax=Sapajus apella TaxID=9515 RepID=A0A6J3J2I2_SAPAP|nr:calcium-binding tyrosine phosphorylation-regulated protein isoform X1 [Sapajus apella]XP_032149066.1 calcium-binding tyrosine phosphorylation-regulated protein isoform X1 [Sapajus apella]XP_032149067.1 calcium-binding tyrosine phosphorylation-regulated protein isoform X1 [Sapajus apella]XP_032149068.1 calcium-binding tyrosine phosphorylation-regulated protein isoform X1 [Sapajus apella]XP_032149069.1 calcium-binding tyrosine phosphorylation-regulated protein isoform X1 [Sapajus apella]
MISSTSRFGIPYGLKTLLEGISRATIKSNPSNINQFAVVYFKELTMYREGNTSLDIKDLVKQFHQTKVQKWSEGSTRPKKVECLKEPEKTSVESKVPTRMEKSTDTEEDNVTGTGYNDKTTQFPSSTSAELGAEQTEAAHDSSPKAATPKTTSPPTSPPPTAVSPEFAYVPADPAQFAAQMLGKVSSIHSDQSDVLMVDVATSMPVVIKEVPSSEAAEDVMVAAPLVYSGKVLEVQVVSQTSVHVDLGSQPKENEAELSTASSVPLQDEQEPPAYDQAPEVPLQADIEVMSTVHISSIYNDVPVTEGVVYVEQLPEQIVIPFTDQVACLKENEQSPPVSPKPVVEKTTSGMSKKSVESVKLAQLEENEKYPSVYMEAEATALLSDTSLKGQPEVPAEPLEAEGTIKIGSEKSLHFEVAITSIVSDNTGQEESGENSAPQEMEGKPVLSGEAAEAVHSGTSVKSSSGPFPSAPEGLTAPEIEPEGEPTAE